MSLGTKIILLFASLLVLHSLFNYGVRKTVEEPTYTQTEKQMMRRELEYFANTLHRQSKNIEILCRNLAARDEFYEFALNPTDNAEDAPANLNTSGLIETNIFVILDNQHNVKYSSITGDDFETPVRIEGFSVQRWSQGHPLLGYEQEKIQSRSGLLKVKDNVVVAASADIRPSGADKIAGKLIIGRRLSEDYLRQLTDTDDVFIEVVSASEAGFREGETITDGYFYAERDAEDNYTALLAISDVAGRASLALKSRIPSTIAAKSREAKRIALIAELSFTLVSILIMLFLLYKIMGRRLERLIDHIIGIRHSGILVKMVQESNGDEIDLLGYEFNQMVTRLQRDIELRRQVETELKRSLTELERFADVASHDLQEPLRSVASCLQLLEMQYKDKIDDQGKQLIEYAVQGSRRMKTLIKALLAYSNIGNTGLAVTTCNCNEIVKEALGELKKDIDQSGAEVICDDLPVIQADKFRLLLLFTNIIHNAIKYAAGGRKPQIRISCENVDRSWRFSISDNGIGIEKEYFKQIFVAFKRLHTQEEYDGSGIGLAICRRIIEQHKGRIWVKSEPGKGSIFYFSIPA
jgi:signal transduction histidine kinase